MYKALVSIPYNEAVETISGRVGEVESALKQKKRDGIVAYFKELCSAGNVDFLEFEKMGIPVNLSASLKSLKDQTKARITKIAEELAVIRDMEDAAEVMVEYKKDCNMPRAMKAVADRKAAVEAQKQQQVTDAAKKKTEQAAVQKVDATLPPPVVAEPSNIVSVKFESKQNPGEYGGREYSYRTEAPLAIGEVVTVPVGKGQSRAVVTAVNVPAENVGCDLSLLKMIPAEAQVRADEKDPNEVLTVQFEVVAPRHAVRDLATYLKNVGIEYRILQNQTKEDMK